MECQAETMETMRSYVLLSIPTVHAVRLELQINTACNYTTSTSTIQLQLRNTYRAASWNCCFHSMKTKVCLFYFRVHRLSIKFQLTFSGCN